MSNDSHKGNDKPSNGGDGVKPARDANGRWLPGHCPNPRGRPKKIHIEEQDQSDMRHFADTFIDVVTNGKIESMDRRAALNNKMFESAMKGRVSMQRFLYAEFERVDQRLAEVIVRYQQLMNYWHIEHPDVGKSDFKIPPEVEVELEQLRDLLNHYFPGDIPFEET